ncbi:helix-turn-helix transcriptional regulator [Galbitalea sp. SE-J8]|uniref:helix-turn-helix transcriptional regulator n=1 Tax=Galbitalea sp. SE-J8 TaxID=3054952 RepID=UPI00259CD8FD|nr:helix-turn-helix transcriptional regulator [Galbitalea sp. SE-J8]MDM4763678.1 helix-turn-helix transcriptional regulator [Galbitalea sp. SE-J8]
MDSRQEISEYLRSRRDRIGPEQVGLAVGTGRRVPGLRREEVAVLAGVSSEYYRRIERGVLSGVSEEVLAAIAHALRLDDAETAHLFDLARAARRPRRVPGRPDGGRPRPGIQRLLDAITGAPAWVRNERMDVLACNPLGRAIQSEVLDSPIARGNGARFVFLDPRSRIYYPDWERGADDIVATLRTYTGRNPADRVLTGLVGELATQSPEFSTRWAAHNVRYHRTGSKRIVHPLVGELDLEFEALELPADPGLTLFTYFPVPDAVTPERLALLGSWTATSAAPAASAADADADAADAGAADAGRA